LAIAVRIARVLTACAVIGVVVVWLAALVPSFPFNLLEHFRLQYTVVALLVVVATAALRISRWFGAACVALLLHLVWIAPAFMPGPRPRAGRPLRVLEVNVLMSNRHFDEVRALIADTQPDVIALIEVDQRWLDALAPALIDYPGRIEHPSSDFNGIALYARTPLTGGPELLGGNQATLVGALSDVTIIAMHTETPTSRRGLRSQHQQFDAVADRMRGLAGPVIVVGDFNTTPWSREFARFLDRSGGCDSRAGFGVQASFPSSSTILGIPIDHVITTCSIGVTDRRVERHVGSDHLPVVVDLVIPKWP
jgi:endonuclease/exonuclease/phosphatase (EEP) superfamily protein YafD